MILVDCNSYIKPLLFIFTGLIVFVTASCDDDSQRIIPEVSVNRTINLSNPSYSDLNHPGSYMYLDEGYKGIIVYHDFDGSYLALERACPYHPSADCARVTVRSSGISIGCGNYQIVDGDEQWEECCGSDFSMQGFVNSGPAEHPLKQYNVARDGSLLTITN